MSEECQNDLGEPTRCSDEFPPQQTVEPPSAPKKTIQNVEKPGFATPTAVEDGIVPQTDNFLQPEQTLAPSRSLATHTSLHTSAISADAATSSPTDGNLVEATSPPSAAVASSSSNGVSKGAVAGIAIATAIIGGAIAFLVAFLLFKRRRRASGHAYSASQPDFIATVKGEHPSYVQVSQSVGPPPVMAATMPTAQRGLNVATPSSSPDFLAGVLPPAADEQTVRNKVAALFNQIQHHVDTFYRDVHATLTPSMKNDLKKFSEGSINLAEELEHSPMPTIALKHALVAYILGIVAPEAEHQATLFPAEVAGLKSNERSIGSPDDQAAYILYKRLAVRLHAPTSAALQSRQSDMREAAEHFALTFFPWANPASNDQDKDQHLVDVINNALDLSIWLFGQPYLYEFVWEGVGRRGTVVAPGLVRVTDERGGVYDGPRWVVEPVIAAG